MPIPSPPYPEGGEGADGAGVPEGGDAPADAAGSPGAPGDASSGGGGDFGQDGQGGQGLERDLGGDGFGDSGQQDSGAHKSYKLPVMAGCMQCKFAACKCTSAFALRCQLCKISSSTMACCRACISGYMMSRHLCDDCVQGAPGDGGMMTMTAAAMGDSGEMAMAAEAPRSGTWRAGYSAAAMIDRVA